MALPTRHHDQSRKNPASGGPMLRSSAVANIAINSQVEFWFDWENTNTKCWIKEVDGLRCVAYRRSGAIFCVT